MTKLFFFIFSFRMLLSCFRYYRVSILLWKLMARLLGLILQKVPESEWLDLTSNRCVCTLVQGCFADCTLSLCPLHWDTILLGCQGQEGDSYLLRAYSLLSSTTNCQKTSEKDKGRHDRWIENMCYANCFSIVQTHLKSFLPEQHANSFMYIAPQSSNVNFPFLVSLLIQQTPY